MPNSTAAPASPIASRPAAAPASSAPKPSQLPGGRTNLEEVPYATRVAAERHVAEAARLRGSGGSSLLVLGSFAQVGAALVLALLLLSIVAVRWRHRGRAGKEAAEKDQRFWLRRLSSRVAAWCGRCGRACRCTARQRSLQPRAPTHSGVRASAAATGCCSARSQTASGHSCDGASSPTRRRWAWGRR